MTFGRGGLQPFKNTLANIYLFMLCLLCVCVCVCVCVFVQHWTTLWVVLKVEVVPNQSYIGYCKKEADWLSDSQTIAKCYLGETFKVERPAPGYSKKYDNVLQLTFKGYRLDLGFDSMTKLDQWHKALQGLSGKLSCFSFFCLHCGWANVTKPRTRTTRFTFW